jgi:hypothetical protein
MSGEQGSTEMINLRTALMVGILLVTVAGVTIFGHIRKHEDDDVYNQIVTIKGNVQILNHPELGKTAASGQYLVFQRVGCKQCLVAVNADVNGNYQVLLGRGRYKIIVRNPSPPTYDMLAPDQPRYVTATSVLQDTRFDINLVVPSSRP